ncbi:AMP-binding protein [Haladaptatus sp. GCM10025893]|uniref:AMP-binding protein n=1 Tax=Haladaptatus sp. GCM10025893 TaxID=3252659 RepID=UPI003622F89B
MRIDELLEMRVEKTPAKPFLTFESQQYTYAETVAASKRYANALAEWGVEQGDRVALFLQNRPEFLFTMFANAYLDSITAPSNPEYKASALRHSLELSQPVVLVTSEPLLNTAIEAARGTTVEEILVVDDVEDYQSLPALAANQSTDVTTPASDDRAIGLHMYTSGTTGPPKAVECEHRNWTISAIDFQKRMGFTHEDVLFTALPLFHANAQIYSTLGAAAAGAEVVIYEKFSSSAGGTGVANTASPSSTRWGAC